MLRGIEYGDMMIEYGDMMRFTTIEELFCIDLIRIMSPYCSPTHFASCHRIVSPTHFPSLPIGAVPPIAI
jgi:hypothetical protein